MGEPHWGFYWAASGDLNRLHEYLVHPNTPIKLNDTTGYVNVQLDSAEDIMPPGRVEAPSELFLRDHDDFGQFWTERAAGWTAVLGDSCLHLALRGGHLAAARLLLKYGNESTLTVKNARGEVPEAVAMAAGLIWPPPNAPVETEVRDGQLIRRRGRGCGFISQIFGMQQHWEYEICVSLSGAEPYSIWRRYSQFKQLWDTMKGHSGLEGCGLPGILQGLSFDSQCQDDVFERQKALDCFIQRVCLCPDLVRTPAFTSFLQDANRGLQSFCIQDPNSNTEKQALNL